jgi:MFS family permease
VAIHGTTLATVFAASSSPTPLYGLYQAQWHFSPFLLTVIFGVYALALLVTLLVTGALSDHIGRRPVLTIALVLQMAAMGLFLVASSVVWLIAARLVQGVAAGLATAALGAALLDFDRQRAAFINGSFPLVGLAVGALGTTALAQWAFAPLHLVFALLLAVFALQLVLTWTTPETSGGRPGAWVSLRPRVSVPVQARAMLAAVTPVNVAFWALGGFYLSLMPSLMAKTTGSTSAWLGSLSVAALTLTGAAIVGVAKDRHPRSVLVGGAVALATGMLLILGGVETGSAGLLLAGSLTSGVGFGASFLGALRSLLPLAGPGERAGLMAAYYVESYLAHVLPALAAGYLAQNLGLVPTAEYFGVAIIALAVAGTLVIALSRRSVDMNAA